MILAGTGHRPKHWPVSSPGAILKLNNLIAQSLSVLKPELVIAGGAQGFDMSLAYVAQSLKIPVHTYAVTNQTKYWDKGGFYGIDTYEELLAKSASVVWHEAGKYGKRDLHMVDNATHVLALYAEKTLRNSGTGLTVNYARDQKKTVINLWDLFLLELYR